MVRAIIACPECVERNYEKIQKDMNNINTIIDQLKETINKMLEVYI